MLADAKKQLEADPAVTRDHRLDVADQLDRALAEVDLTYAEDGLVIFAAPGEHQVWSLARTVPERVVLSDTFLTRNLVAAEAAERPFWVLTVAADRATLWNGGADRVAEEHIGGFPMIRSRENFDAERQERIGDMPSTFRDEGPAASCAMSTPRSAGCCAAIRARCTSPASRPHCPCSTRSAASPGKRCTFRTEGSPTPRPTPSGRRSGR